MSSIGTRLVLSHPELLLHSSSLDKRGHILLCSPDRCCFCSFFKVKRVEVREREKSHFTAINAVQWLIIAK